MPKKNGRSAQAAALRETQINAVAPKHKPKGDPTGPFDLPRPDDWSHHEDLDVVEEAPLPPPPSLRKA